MIVYYLGIYKQDIKNVISERPLISSLVLCFIINRFASIALFQIPELIEQDQANSSLCDIFCHPSNQINVLFFGLTSREYDADFSK